MVWVIVVVGWETSSILGVKVLGWVSAFVEICFALVVSIQWSEQSIPRIFFVLISNSVSFVLIVVLLLHLLQNDGVIVGGLLDHRCLGLQIWPWVILVLEGRVVSEFIGDQASEENAGETGVPPEILPGGPYWINIWMVVDPPLDWDSGNSTLRDHCSSANKHCKWPGKSSTKQEVDDPLSSVGISKLFVVFPWDSLGAWHELSWSHGEPFVTLDIILEPWIKRNENKKGLTIACIRVHPLCLAARELQLQECSQPLWFSAV